MASNKHSAKTGTASCYHCGERCDDDTIALAEKYFCCQGCKMVFSILYENDLCTYYDLNEVAGISQKNNTQKEYAFLDDADTVSRLISFSDEKQTKVRFYIPQIHCSSCLWLLENLHLMHGGIYESRVDFLKKEVLVTYNHQEIALRQVVELLAAVGYAPHINLRDLDQNTRPLTDKSLFYKLGLAGFAFGNIMLLSFPEYFGLSDEGHSDFNAFISYIILILALPVVFYSGWDYLRSAWQGLKQRHLNIDVPVSLGILALFFRSFYEIITQTGAGYFDSLAGLIFFLLIGKWFQQATFARITFDRDFKSYFPIACTIKTASGENQVTLDKLDKGDTVLIRHGELIPADTILMNGQAQIDYSFVTGESELIDKKSGDLLYAGGRQMGGLIEVTVTKKVSNSYLTQLWNDHAFSKSNTDGLVNVIADKVAGIFTRAILLIALATLFYWIPRDTSMAINAFTAVLIVACPCAVALSIPFTFGNVVRFLALNKIYFKNIHVIETLAKATHVVFDKTGTLTHVDSSRLYYEGETLSSDEMSMIHSLARHSTHPLSRLIEQHFREADVLSVDNFLEIKGQGVVGTIRGKKIRLGSADFISAHHAQGGGIFIEIDGELKGFFKQQNQYRSGLAKVLDELHQRVRISLLSGDHDGERAALTPFFGADAQLHFNKKPEEKLTYIKELQQESDVVVMVGDGLNDAGALSQSHVGVVVSEDTSNFTPACDVIMDASQFEKLPRLFSLARASIHVVYASYAIALLYNIIGLSYAVQGLLSPVIAAILMPLSSVTIVLIGVGLSTYLMYRRGFTGKAVT
jgi:Cu+-exporting ATPase